MHRLLFASGDICHLNRIIVVPLFDVRHAGKLSIGRGILEKSAQARMKREVQALLR